MQNLVDSFCQCFGTAVPQHGTSAASTPLESLHLHNESPHANRSTGLSTNSNKENGRRSRSLTPNVDLFSKKVQPAKVQSDLSSGHRRNRSMDQTPTSTKSSFVGGIDHKSTSRNYKRKRSCSKVDIFRSKQNPSTTNSNPFSRFISNNPVIINALCFANPVRDSVDLCDAGSVVSESNTLNTAEDTITSTLYYEKTKLAGLKQKNPPVPLFNCFAVDADDDIRQIVKTHSHSSVKLLDMYGSRHKKHPAVVWEEEVPQDSTPPTSPPHDNFSLVTPRDQSPPPSIANLSSDSSSNR